MDIVQLLIAAASMGGIGLLLAGMLVIADKKFHVFVDPKLEKVQDALPGINCGACGFPGCNGLADQPCEPSLTDSQGHIYSACPLL